MAIFSGIGEEIESAAGGTPSQSGLLGYTVEGRFRVVDPDDPSRFFVRFPNGNFVSALHGGKVPQTPNRPVLVGRDRLGRPVILGDDPTSIAAYLGSGSGGAPGGGSGGGVVGWHTHVRGSGMEFIEDPWMLKYLRVTPGDDLSVVIAAGWYSYNGTLHYFPETTLDASATVPANVDYQRWFKVGIDPVTETAVLTIGSDFFGIGAPDPSGIDDVEFESLGYIPLVAVWVTSGQTELFDYEFIDLRFPPRLGSDSGASSGRFEPLCLDSEILFMGGDVVMAWVTG